MNADDWYGREWHYLKRGPAAMTDRTCDSCHREATEYVGYFTNVAYFNQFGVTQRVDLKPSHVFACEHHGGNKVMRVGRTRIPWPVSEE